MNTLTELRPGNILPGLNGPDIASKLPDALGDNRPPDVVSAALARVATQGAQALYLLQADRMGNLPPNNGNFNGGKPAFNSN